MEKERLKVLNFFRKGWCQFRIRYMTNMAAKNIAVYSDTKVRRSWVCSVCQVASVVILIYVLGSVFILPVYRQDTPKTKLAGSMDILLGNGCENQCRPRGSESLPRGIVAKNSNLEMRPLWGLPKKRNSSQSLLAMAVGIKQTELVNAMVGKFLSNGISVMLFHYDGNVNQWKEFWWNDRVVHVSAINQTKWWFAKRFMHPDVVAAYEYIFLWDEDLGVDEFDPLRYISIVKEEGLQISQPALDGNKSEVHHQITARGRRERVHRRIYKNGECDDDSKGPPCTGWIEVMAPNDLIHAWGLDMQLGYCAQGDRTKTIGVVDAEYVVHHGLPTLGEPSGKKLRLHTLDKRVEVRRQSYNEYKVFRRRWAKAAANDECWTNPYPEPLKPILR
ncbi:Phospholipase D3 [Bienertia sinuspersici]